MRILLHVGCTVRFLAGARGAGSKVRNSNIELVAPCFCTVSGGTTEPTRVRPKRPWMVGRGVATRQEGWGLARCYCWLQVTRRGMEVLYGLFDAVSCIGELFARSTKCMEFVRPTWCTLTGVYNLAKDCPHNGSCTPHRDLRKHVW